MLKYRCFSDFFIIRVHLHKAFVCYHYNDPFLKNKNSPNAFLGGGVQDKIPNCNGKNNVATNSQKVFQFRLPFTFSYLMLQEF